MPPERRSHAPSSRLRRFALRSVLVALASLTLVGVGCDHDDIAATGQVCHVSGEGINQVLEVSISFTHAGLALPAGVTVEYWVDLGAGPEVQVTKTDATGSVAYTLTPAIARPTVHKLRLSHLDETIDFEFDVQELPCAPVAGRKP